MTGKVMPHDLLIGLDIGGTALKAVRIRADGSDLETLTVQTGRALDRAAALATIRTTVATLARGETVARIGCAMGGIVRADGTMPADGTNLPHLAETPLPRLFADALGAPCHALNDARAAMHGEAWLGAARTCSNALLITLGTGIGSGLMLDGRIYRGARGFAGEIGSWPENMSSFEAVASPVNVEARSGHRLGDMLRDASLDEHGQSAIDAIGRTLARIHMLLDLDVIIIGGSISAVGEPLRAAVEAAFVRYCPPVLRGSARIVVSELGAYAGAIGAVAPSAIESQS